MKEMMNDNPLEQIDDEKLKNLMTDYDEIICQSYSIKVMRKDLLGKVKFNKKLKKTYKDTYNKRLREIIKSLAAYNSSYKSIAKLIYHYSNSDVAPYEISSWVNGKMVPYKYIPIITYLYKKQIIEQRIQQVEL